MSSQQLLVCCCGEPEPTGCPPSCECLSSYLMVLSIFQTFTSPTFGDYTSTVTGEGVVVQGNPGCFYNPPSGSPFSQVVTYEGGGVGDAYSGEYEGLFMFGGSSVFRCFQEVEEGPISSLSELLMNGPTVVRPRVILSGPYQPCPPGWSYSVQSSIVRVGTGGGQQNLEATSTSVLLEFL